VGETINGKPPYKKGDELLDCSSTGGSSEIEGYHYHDVNSLAVPKWTRKNRESSECQIDLKLEGAIVIG